MRGRSERLALAVPVALGVCWLALAGGPAMATVPAPDDPSFRHQWNLRAIQIPSAWSVSRGAGAVVAVLDTGVAYENRGPFRRAPDLAGTRFVPGWDFVDGDAHPNDVPPPDGRRSHGTLMAGLIAQTTDNGIGGAGVAPAATILPVRVLRPDVTGSPRTIARGLRFAADRGAVVANLSISGRTRSREVSAAVDYAAAKGVTVVAASGNDGRASVTWPAAYPKVIAVGAVTRDRARAPYSSFGSALDLVAPAGAGERFDAGFGPPDGVSAQTLKGGPSDFCICFSASTSAAAAQVSGVAALLIASGRARTPARVRAALESGARDLGPPGRDREFGAGLVQAAGALGIEAAPAGPPGARQESSRSVWWFIGGCGAALAVLLGVVRARRRRAP